MPILKIKKRDARVVEFESQKITSAMEKAMIAVLGRADRDKLAELTTQVMQEVEGRFGSDGTPDVEIVQDIVERTMMSNGLFNVARAYILYRERHREMREQRQRENLKKIEEKMLFVVKRNGQREPFDDNKLRVFFQWAMRGFEGVVDVEEMAAHAKVSVYEGIKTEDIAKLAVMTAKAFIERDPHYSTITTRLFLAFLYKEAVGGKFAIGEWGIGAGSFSGFDLDNFAGKYQEAFIRNMKRGVDIGRLSPKLLQFDLPRLAKNLVIERDQLIGYRGLQTLYDRYFTLDQEKHVHLETPQMFWMRVAMGLALQEQEKESWAIKFYEVLSTLRFVSSTPTLFNAGTISPQLSSCYLTTVEDDLHHIFKCIGDNAQLSKFSGGLGNDWTNLRATGAWIKSTGVESQGVIPFLKIANDTTVAINRSGKRRGATCAYLETWHLDIEEFLDLRRNSGDERRRTHDMNTANWIPDLFMKRVFNDEYWTLFSPHDVPELHHLYGRAFEEKYLHYERQAERGELIMHKRVKARDLWKKMLTRLFETGHPWITFKDPCNIRSPQDHAGVVHSSNLCTEITLNTSAEETAVCNLGSVNFARHIANSNLNHELVRNTVTTAIRMLDNVIDLNYYPTIEAKNSNLRHRPIGLGIMGYQDALFMLNINFDSNEAVEFADESMELIAHAAISASSELAKERGPYSSYKGSKWDRGLFPQDTLALLEEGRGMSIDLPKTGKLDWTPVRASVRQYGMRNSNCMAIAPTATIANISGCFPSIEPIYKNLYVKSNMSGEFTVDNHYLINDLKARGLWNKTILEKVKEYDGSISQIALIPQDLREKYKEAFEIEPEWLILAAARRGKWIDQSQSLNIFSATSSGKRLSDIYLYAWRMGLKTTYYLRTMAASGIEKSTVSHLSNSIGTESDASAALAIELPGEDILPSITLPITDTLPLLATANAGSSVYQIGPVCEACQ